MTDLTSTPLPTLRTLFEIPGEGDPARLPDGWKQFRGKLAEEVKGIKWVAAMPDLTSKIAELLDVKVPALLLPTWKKAVEIKTRLAESHAAPEKTFYEELAGHTISISHHPYITVLLASKTVKTVEFTVTASLTLNGFVLKIQKGEVQEIRTGSCQAEGTLEGLGLLLAKKELAPLYFPGSIQVTPVMS